jgi:hypothetical protein
MRDDDLDDPEKRDNLVGLEGLRQRGRAAYVRLTDLEADGHRKVPLTGTIEQVGVLRRRETGSALFEGLTPCAYIVRLDDGALVHGFVGADKLDDPELARFSAIVARLQILIADEQHRRAVGRG